MHGDGDQVTRAVNLQAVGNDFKSKCGAFLSIYFPQTFSPVLVSCAIGVCALVGTHIDLQPKHNIT